MNGSPHGSDWDDKSIDNIFHKKRQAKTTPKQKTPSDTAPKKIPVQRAPGIPLTDEQKRAREMARRRYLIRKAQIMRRRRIIALLILAAVSILLITATIAGVGAVKKKLAAKEKAKNDAAENLSALEAFRESGDVFYTADGNETVSLLHQMFHTFTLADDGNNAVPLVKKEPSAYEWDMLKYAWYGDRTYLSAVKEAIKEIAIAKNGYIWSQEKSAASTVSGSYLYDTNLKFISAVAGICLWDANLDFLNSVDTTTAGALDISQGKTVGEKLELAVNYVLSSQYITKNNLFADTNAANTGTSKGAPSNYWYNYRFGNYDAYNNIYFHHAMTQLSKLYSLAGDEEKAAYYGSIAQLNKQAFQTFWDSDKGRFAGAIDVNGAKHDYGFVFLNLEAIYYGLADSAQQKSIFEWLDGERVISGDTSAGNDIYANRFAPRNNTVAADPNWWYDEDDKRLPDNNASFGKYYQNGGSSLLTAYYDIMARLKTNRKTSAFQRISDLVAEYKKDKLLRNGKQDTSYQFATNGPFSESGLAPALYVYGLFGIDTDGKTLTIRPNLPKDIISAGLKKIGFSGNSYHLLLDGNSAFLTADSYAPVRIRYGGFEAGQKVKYEYYEKEKPSITETLTADNSGYIYIEEAFGKDSFIKLTTESGKANE